MSDQSIDKTVRIGTVPIGVREHVSVYIHIQFDGKRLSISGVEGPLSNGNAVGSCGQIIMSFREYDKRGHMSIADIIPVLPWTSELIQRLFNVWDKWHSNDMRSGCEHQRAGWNPSEEIEVAGQVKTAGWVYPKEHERGLLAKPCEVCGYKYGTQWLAEEVPVEVVGFLRSLPDTDKVPAWA